MVFLMKNVYLGLANRIGLVFIAAWLVLTGCSSSEDSNDGVSGPIVPVNMPPVAVDDAASTDEDTPVSIDVTANLASLVEMNYI